MAVAEKIEHPGSPERWDDLVQAGVAKKVLEDLARTLEMNPADLAPQLHVSARTLRRYDAKKNLPREASERLLLLVRVYQRACEVIKDPARAATWIKRPNRALEGKSPLEMMESIFGAERVMDLLGRIEHGVFS